VNYLEDTLANFQHFGLPEPALVRAFSTDPEAIQTIAAGEWDCIYIDGNHDYDVARSDWDHCSRALKPGGLIVLDDSGITTEYLPPAFATRGHPGPSQLAEEIVREGTFSEILQVGHNRVFQKRNE
jgi:predicted O-methyltransferase YrrM